MALGRCGKLVRYAYWRIRSYSFFFFSKALGHGSYLVALILTWSSTGVELLFAPYFRSVFINSNFISRVETVEKYA